ncbi:MAG: hypothetical protein ACI8PZ_006462, partial [Myxococcota bacterium]
MIALAMLLACGGSNDGPGLLPALRNDSPDLQASAGPDRVALVGEPLEITGDGSVGASFRWTFGDGETSVPSSTADTSHVWRAPGHYLAFVVATDIEGRTESDSVAVTVVHPPAASPPRMSATLAHEPTTDSVWVAMPALGAVAVVDADREVRHVPVCASPRSVATGGGSVVVACGDDALVWIDPTDDSTHRLDLPYGSAPFGVVVTDAGDVLATLSGSGELYRLAATADEPELVAVGPDLRGLAWTGDAILVSRHRSPDDGGVWWRLDPETLAVLDTHHLPIAEGPDSDTASRGVPTYLQRIAVRPDGRVAVFPGLRANIERGEWLDRRPLTHETTARADLRAVALVPDEGEVGVELRAAHFDDRDHAIAAAYFPRGDWLYAVHPGAEAIDVLDAVTLARVGSVRGAGHAPDGLLVV